MSLTQYAEAFVSGSRRFEKFTMNTCRTVSSWKTYTSLSATVGDHTVVLIQVQLC